MTTDIVRPASSARRTWRMMLALVVIAGGLSLAGLALSPVPAQAAPVSINQCNDRNSGALGATTGITCTVTVVNVINGGARSSTVTVTRTCSLNPCAVGDVAAVLRSVTTSYTDVVTDITQCNDSGNDAAPPLITCNVTVTNNISADTPGAQPVTAATVNQCNRSGTGLGTYGGVPPGPLVCDPFPATTNPATATVVQCNDSVTGGGSTAECTVASASRVSPAIPIRVNQCNNTGIAGGTLLTCRTTITTNITAAVGGTSTPTPQISRVPSGGVPAGGGSGEGSGGGLSPVGILSLGGALLLSAMAVGLFGWRAARRA